MDRVRILRLSKGLRQDQLAAYVGVSNKQISLIETGRRNPSVEVLKALADALGTTTDYLLGRGKDNERSVS